jgi:hypothetical protein
MSLLFRRPFMVGERLGQNIKAVELVEAIIRL